MKKLIIFIDGDNAPQDRIDGASLLSAKDELHIYESRKSTEPNKGLYFSDAFIKGLKQRTPATVFMTPVDRGEQAVDFRIAMDLAVHASQAAEDSIYCLLSGDSHYNIILREFQAVNHSAYDIVKLATVRQCAERYLPLLCDTSENLKAQLKKLLGEQIGLDAYNNLTEVFNSIQEDSTSLSTAPQSPPFIKWWRRR